MAKTFGVPGETERQFLKVEHTRSLKSTLVSVIVVFIFTGFRLVSNVANSQFYRFSFPVNSTLLVYSLCAFLALRAKLFTELVRWSSPVSLTLSVIVLSLDSQTLRPDLSLLYAGAYQLIIVTVSLIIIRDFRINRFYIPVATITYYSIFYFYHGHYNSEELWQALQFLFYVMIFNGVIMFLAWSTEQERRIAFWSKAKAEDLKGTLEAVLLDLPVGVIVCDKESVVLENHLMRKIREGDPHYSILEWQQYLDPEDIPELKQDNKKNTTTLARYKNEIIRERKEKLAELEAMEDSEDREKTLLLNDELKIRKNCGEFQYTSRQKGYGEVTKQFDVIGAAVEWKESAAVLFTFKDITNMKTDYIKMKELDKIKNNLLRAVSHDMRTPLNGIRAMLMTLEDVFYNLKAFQQGDGVQQKLTPYSTRQLNNPTNPTTPIRTKSVDATGMTVQKPYLGLESGKDVGSITQIDLQIPKEIGTLSQASNYEELIAEGAHCIEVAKNGADFVTFLISDLLDYFQLKSFKFRIVKEEINLRNLISKSLNMIKTKAEDKGVNLQFSYSPDCIEEVFNDSRRIQQVLLNLVTNSLKYTSSGGNVNVRVRPDETNSSAVIIEIEDTGIGIPENEIPHLFREFGCVLNHDSRKYNPHGVGLGLFICKKLSEQLGSGIHLQSTYHKGTRVWYSVDRNLMEDDWDDTSSTTSDHTEERPSRGSTMHQTTALLNGVRGPVTASRQNKTKKGTRRLTTDRMNGVYNSAHEPIQKELTCLCPQVLIADDYNLNILMLQKLLSTFGISAEGVSDGESAVDAVIARNSSTCCRRYMMIVLDYSMPMMTGPEAARTLRDKMTTGEILKQPLVGYTAYGDSGEEAEHFKRCGVEDLIGKPADVPSLERCLFKLKCIQEPTK